MEYHILLDMVTELGYQLAMCGAETFRVEESISRILRTYNTQAEVFAIPNCLHVSIVTEDGQSLTRMRRIGEHGNDLDAVERYTDLSRRICAQKPTPKEAAQWLREVSAGRIRYSLPVFLISNFLAAFGFCFLFGARLDDAICSGVCGLLLGVISKIMDYLKANQFFRLIIAAFLMAVLAYGMIPMGLATNADAIIIGALMLLVPGLLFTNALRDIIYGDINSGTNRIVQVFLIAIALALGTGVAWNTAAATFGAPVSVAGWNTPLWLECLGSLICCLGFSLIFNIHGPGILICILGGCITWIIYDVSRSLGVSEIMAYFWATLFSSLYAEIMARIRKYPAISYLVVAVFPLIPGAGIYYTMNHVVRNDMDAFVQQGLLTVGIAGSMAVAILLGSTVFKIISTYQKQRNAKKSR